MSTIECYLSEIKKDEAKAIQFHEYLVNMFSKLKEHDAHHYHKRMCEIHKIVYGDHFNESLACQAVSNMENADGSVGGHWKLEDTTLYANRYNLNKYDFYYVMNMLYSDFSCALNSKDAELFAKLAQAYITDKDTEEGKAFKLYMASHIV